MVSFKCDLLWGTFAKVAVYFPNLDVQSYFVLTYDTKY